MRLDDPRHGTYAGGRVHRLDNETVCDPCRRAEARYENERQLDILAGRARMVPAHGTRLRLRALVALGHSWARIGPALGMSPAGACALAARPRTSERATTHAKVLALYDAWSMTLPPANSFAEKKARTYALTVATKHGWLPPLALDDDRLDDPTYQPVRHAHDADRPDYHDLLDHVVVERFIDTAHRPRKLTRAEGAEAYRRLRARGVTTHDIEHRYGLKPERYQLEEAS